MKVLVAGASGMLGTDVVRASEWVNHEVVGLDLPDLDITDPDAVLQRVVDESPDAIVNCAAYTAVDAAEDDMPTAMAVNADGARNLALAARRVGAKIVYPSTDYVFDGTKGEPYVETDEPLPLNVYAQTKVAGEQETAACCEQHFIVRSSWLFGTGGPNFVETMLQLAEDQEFLVVVRDQVGCPTYTAHLADAIVRLIDTGAYGLHHIAGDGECSWYEFAVEIFRQAGVDCRVMSCSTDEYPRPAARPAYSVLGTVRQEAIYLPMWHDGLSSYLTERAHREVAA